MLQSAREFPTLRIFIRLLLLFWMIAAVVAIVEAGAFKLSSDYWYPLFLPSVRFTDLTIYTQRFHYFHQENFFASPGFPFTYPAPIAVAYECFFFLGSYALTGFIIFCLAVFGTSAVWLGLAMRSRGANPQTTFSFLCICFLLSYPLWFLVDRGNLEAVSWLMVALGVFFYWKKKWYIAAMTLGVAASMKLFPLVFLGLLIGARKYRAFVCGIFSAIVATILSTWFVGPTFKIASSGIAQGLQYFQFQYALQVHKAEIGFDHSLFAIVKELAVGFRMPNGNYPPLLLDSYLAAATLTGIGLFFWKIKNLTRINQVMALTVSSILLPPVSSDYTLTYLYIPWALLVLISVSRASTRIPGLIAHFACLAFLMAPESYCMVHGIRFAGQLKAVVLVLLLALSLVFQFEDPVSLPEV